MTHEELSQESTGTALRAKVGVFMPCYNMGPFLEESLDSLYAQTFTDFHVVIADDASTDPETIGILQALERERCRVVFEPENLGLIAISNKYMADIDADYIMLFSPDDRMAPEFLQVQVDYLDAHPDVAAVCTWIQSFGESDAVIEYSDELCRLPEMLVDNHFSGAAVMRKSAWLAAGMHDPDPELYPNLDYDLWLSMLTKGMSLATIPRALFYWRVVGTSLSHAVSAERMRGFRRALVRKYADAYREHSSFVADHHIDVIARFEDYYNHTEEGRAWLQSQNASLTRELGRLVKENGLLRDEISALVAGHGTTTDRRIRDAVRRSLRRFRRK